LPLSIRMSSLQVILVMICINQRARPYDSLVISPVIDSGIPRIKTNGAAALEFGLELVERLGVSEDPAYTRRLFDILLVKHEFSDRELIFRGDDILVSAKPRHSPSVQERPIASFVNIHIINSRHHADSRKPMNNKQRKAAKRQTESRNRDEEQPRKERRTGGQEVKENDKAVVLKEGNK